MRDCDSVRVCITTVQASGPEYLGYKGPKPTTMNTTTFPPRKQAQMNTLSTRLSLFESVRGPERNQGGGLFQIKGTSGGQTSGWDRGWVSKLLGGEKRARGGSEDSGEGW